MIDIITTSRRVRAIDFGAGWLRARAREMCLDTSPVSNGLGLVSTQRMHRKIWEFGAIAEIYSTWVISSQRSIKSLGFGCGREPLPAWLASQGPYSQGSYVIATDSPYDNVNWTETNQRAVKFSDLPWEGICSEEQREHIIFQFADMNHISNNLLQGEFDFTWSCGSFEHIGGIDAGVEFFCNQMCALRPGGIAAHTTEFNPVDGAETLNEPNLCLYRERDLRKLEARLADQGDRLWSLDLSMGEMEEDKIVDVPPYTGDVHLSIKVGEWTTTSVLLVAERGAV